MLFLHEALCCLGLHMCSLTLHLSVTTDVNILAIEYPGYGLAGGKPNESSIDAAAQAAFDWLHFQMKVPLSRILLWGYSVGTGVAVSLAARTQTQLKLVCL